MDMITKDQVLESLKEVIDPELGINIVDLGLIYDLIIEGPKVKIKMTLTSPGCPLYGMIHTTVSAAVRKTGAEDVDLELVFEPPWTPDKISPEAKKVMGLS